MVRPVTNKKVNLAPLALNQAFRQLKDHAVTSLGTAAILCIPLAFIGAYTSLRPGWGAMLAGYAVGALLTVVVAYAVTVASGMYAEGNDPGVGGLMRRTASTGLLRYIATSMLFNLVLWVAAGLALIPFFVSLGSVGSRALSFRLSETDFLRIFLGLLFSLPLLGIAMSFVYLKLGLSQPASALDRTGPAASLRRSWQLTKGRVWDFFLLLLMTFALGLAISIFVSGPAGVVSISRTPEPTADPLSPAFYAELFAPPEPLGPAAAMVTGISGYLTSLLLTSVTSAILANFFLLVRSPPESVEQRRDGRMVPLRRPEQTPEETPPGSERPA